MSEQYFTPVTLQSTYKPQSTNSTKSSSTPYPVASVPGGGTRYSDGSVRYVSVAGTNPSSKSSSSASGNSTGTASSSSSGSNSYDYTKSLLSQMSGSVDKYVNDLIDFAKDDYNFAAKWIEDQFVKASGPDAPQRKEFLKTVASALEEKVGRVQYDYQTNKYRLQGKTDLALQRLNEDEATLTKQYKEDSALQRSSQNSSLNARGLISGTREGATGLAGKEVGQLESNITSRMDALSRSVGRSKQDILTANTQGMEDLATGARRSMIDSQSSRDYSIDNAARTRDKAILDAEQRRKSLKDTLAALEGSIA